MLEIKVLDETVDTKNIEMHYYDWDVVVNNEPYAVFSFPGYVHCIGGSRGENSLYCCPISNMKCENCALHENKDIVHDKSKENRMKPERVFSCCKNFRPQGKDLILFNGESCSWSVHAESNNYIKSKCHSRVEHTYTVTILRNGKKFYSIGCHDMDWGMAKARKMLTEIWEHSVPFCHRDYEKYIVGRKIFYNGYPAIMESYYAEGGTIVISPDKDVCDYVVGFDGSRYVNSFPEDMFCGRIFWWRSEEDTEKWMVINRSISVKNNFPLVEGSKGDEYVGDRG